MPDSPHYDFPLRIDPLTSALAEVEQDSLDDIAARVAVVCSTLIGERDAHPDFGISDLAVSRNPVDLDALHEQILDSEPSASVLLEQDPERFDEVVQTVVVNVDRAGGVG